MGSAIIQSFNDDEVSYKGVSLILIFNRDEQYNGRWTIDKLMMMIAGSCEVMMMNGMKRARWLPLRRGARARAPGQASQSVRGRKTKKNNMNELRPNMNFSGHFPGRIL